jgi:hypothetical protein
MSEVQSTTTYKCNNQSCGDLESYLMACKYSSWKLAMNNHELTKVYLLLIISFGCIWVDWIGYICNVACYEMFEWIKSLVIKFGLVCVE